MKSEVSEEFEENNGKNSSHGTFDVFRREAEGITGVAKPESGRRIAEAEDIKASREGIEVYQQAEMQKHMVRLQDIALSEQKGRFLEIQVRIREKQEDINSQERAIEEIKEKVKKALDREAEIEKLKEAIEDLDGIPEIWKEDINKLKRSKRVLESKESYAEKKHWLKERALMERQDEHLQGLNGDDNDENKMKELRDNFDSAMNAHNDSRGKYWKLVKKFNDNKISPEDENSERARLRQLRVEMHKDQDEEAVRVDQLEEAEVKHIYMKIENIKKKINIMRQKIEEFNRLKEHLQKKERISQDSVAQSDLEEELQRLKEKYTSGIKDLLELRNERESILMKIIKGDTEELNWKTSEDMEAQRERTQKLETYISERKPIVKVANKYKEQYNAYCWKNDIEIRGSVGKMVTERAEYIYRNFRGVCVEKAIEAEVHLKARFDLTLDSLYVDGKGSLVLDRSNNEHLHKLTYTPEGHIKVDGAISRVYGTLFLEKDPKRLVLIRKRDRGFAAGTPMIPGGLVTIDSLVKIEPENTNIFKISLYNRANREMYNQYAISQIGSLSGTQSQTRLGGQQEIVWFYKATVTKTEKSSQRGHSRAGLNAQGAFELDLNDFIGKHEGLLDNDTEVARALLDYTGYQPKEREHRGEYMNAYCTHQLVKEVRAYKEDQQRGDTSKPKGQRSFATSNLYDVLPEE